jgi:hypothetical protein
MENINGVFIISPTIKRMCASQFAFDVLRLTILFIGVCKNKIAKLHNSKPSTFARTIKGQSNHSTQTMKLKKVAFPTLT